MSPGPMFSPEKQTKKNKINLCLQEFLLLQKLLLFTKLLEDDSFKSGLNQCRTDSKKLTGNMAK